MRHRGVVLSPAVIPIALTVTWRKLTSAGIIFGAVIGATLGESDSLELSWSLGNQPFSRYDCVDDWMLENIRQAFCLTSIIILGLTVYPPGVINLPNLAQPYSAVCSGLTGFLFSGIITVGVSLMSWVFDFLDFFSGHYCLTLVRRPRRV